MKRGIRMRGDQLARQWRIIRGIEASSNGLTVAEIAKREETGLRTIYRDLEALQSAGFPLYNEKVDKANRWAFVDTYKFKIPAPFTLSELMSLYFYKDLVRVFKGTPFHDSIDSVFKKIQSTLPPQALVYLDQMQSVFHVGIKPYKDYAQFRNILNQVNQAAMERRRVEMVYHSLHRKEKTLRKVDPFKVWFYDGTIYLVGLCHLREEVRMFVLDRIKMLCLQPFDNAAEGRIGARAAQTGCAGGQPAGRHRRQSGVGGRPEWVRSTDPGEVQDPHPPDPGCAARNPGHRDARSGCPNQSHSGLIPARRWPQAAV